VTDDDRRRWFDAGSHDRRRRCTHDLSPATHRRFTDDSAPTIQPRRFSPDDSAPTIQPRRFSPDDPIAEAKGSPPMAPRGEPLTLTAKMVMYEKARRKRLER